ncbi:MAG: hypothetical protein WAV98_04005 [Minisyncoccia bacterium]
MHWKFKKTIYEGKKLGIFTYQGKPTALYGVDLNKRLGEYEVIAELFDGT